jgi:hypothetical protein
VHVYVIQEPAIQNSDMFYSGVDSFYKQLLNRGELDDATIRKFSLARSKYDAEQTSIFLDLFGHFNNTRGFTLIKVNDFVCDSAFCLIGTGEVPFYHDHHHLTWLGSLRLTELLRKYVSY